MIHKPLIYLFAILFFARNAFAIFEKGKDDAYECDLSRGFFADSYNLILANTLRIT